MRWGRFIDLTAITAGTILIGIHFDSFSLALGVFLIALYMVD